MTAEENKSNWWIWKAFWILLFLTTFEVLLGMFKGSGSLPDFLVNETFLGLFWLTHIFIILTLIKAGYIVMTFMHLGFETKALRWTILLPPFVLIPYLLFILLTEAVHTYFIQ